MRYFLLALFVFSLAAADAPVAPPSPVKSVLDAYEADALKAFLAYKQAAAKAGDKAAKDMDAKLKAATKAGNLDAANAIKAEMDKLNKGETLLAMEDKWRATASADLLSGGAKASKLVIISAKFGTVSATVDVTEYLQKKVVNDSLIIPKIHGETMAREGINDPAPGDHKSLTVTYTMNGAKKSITVAEFLPLIIEPPKR